MKSSRTLTVTGAAGHLGSRCVSTLTTEGYQVVPTDVVKASYPGFVQADLADPASLREALRESEMVVHCASIHPWKKYTDQQYIQSNINGTWNLYREAAEMGISRIVLTSSISAIGYPDHPADTPLITEDCRYPLKDLYGLTKNVQETIASSYATTRGIRTIAIRPPPFMPKPWLETGFLLTGVFAIVDDIASAHVAAVNTMMSEEERPLFEAFFAVNDLPYTRDDVLSLGPDANVRPLVRKHWPTQYEWLITKGYRGIRFAGRYDISKARERLGWRPRHNFPEWLEENADRVSEDYKSAI